MWQRHNAQLANFDVTSLRVIRVNSQTAAAHLEKAIKLPWRVFITEGFFLNHVKRMRERPTRRPGDHQRVDVDEDEAMRRYLSRVESLMTNHYYAKVQTINRQVCRDA